MSYNTQQKNLDILHGRVSRLNRTITDFQEQIDALLRCIDAMQQVLEDDNVQMAEEVSKEVRYSEGTFPTEEGRVLLGNNGEPLPLDQESLYDGYKEEHNF